jgi:hypothetical protein
MCQSAQYEPPTSWNLKTTGSPRESQHGHDGGSSDQARNQQPQLGSQMVPRGLHGFQQRLERIGVCGDCNLGLCMSSGRTIRLAGIGTCRSADSRTATLVRLRFPRFVSGAAGELSLRIATSGRSSVHVLQIGHRTHTRNCQPGVRSIQRRKPSAFRRLLSPPECGLVHLSNCTR